MFSQIKVQKKYYLALLFLLFAFHPLLGTPAGDSTGRKDISHGGFKINRIDQGISRYYIADNEEDFEKRKYRYLKRMKVAGIICTAASGVFVTTGFIIGLIPHDAWGPAINARLPMFSHIMYTDSYSYMVIIGSLGVSLTISGLVLFLVGLPLLLYSILKKRAVKKAKEKKSSVSLASGMVVIRFTPGRSFH